MKLHQIESWALDIVDRVQSGQPVEDSRVELKAEWIDPVKAFDRHKSSELTSNMNLWAKLSHRVTQPVHKEIVDIMNNIDRI